MKSEQRWQKVGLVSITFRKAWPGAAGPGDLALARSGPDPGPAPASGSGRARPPLPRSGLEAGLPGRGEPPPSQARAPDSAAAAIPDRGGQAPKAGERQSRAADRRGRGPSGAPAVRSARLPTAPAATAQARTLRPEPARRLGGAGCEAERGAAGGGAGIRGGARESLAGGGADAEVRL